MEPVSWQSAFWGVFAIAANTFIQDPGRIIDCANPSGRLLRLSPYLCASDTVYVLICFIDGLMSGHSLPAVATAIAHARQLEIKRWKAPRSSGALLKKGMQIGLPTTFFALVQLVKLTGMRGIMFTTIYAWFYFISFLSVGLIKWLAGLHTTAPVHSENGSDTTTSPPPMPDMYSLPFQETHFVVCLSTCGAVMAHFTGWISILLTGKTWFESPVSLPLFMILCYSQSALRPLAIPWSAEDRGRVILRIQNWDVVVLVSVFLAFGCLFVGIIDDTYDVGCIAAMAPIAIALLGGRIIGAIVLKAQKWLNFTLVEDLQHWMSWWIATGSFGMVIAWYTLIWTDVGTAAPFWTRRLG